MLAKGKLFVGFGSSTFSFYLVSRLAILSIRSELLCVGLVTSHGHSAMSMRLPSGGLLVMLSAPLSDDAERAPRAERQTEVVVGPGRRIRYWDGPPVQQRGYRCVSAFTTGLDCIRLAAISICNPWQVLVVISSIVNTA